MVRAPIVGARSRALWDVAPVERSAFDYSDLEHGMAQLDLVFARPGSRSTRP
jgi:hypothetical protein